MIPYIERVLDGSPQGYHECRRCGTTVEGVIDACPECGSGDIVHYPRSILQ